MARRFHIPMMGIVALVLALLVIFFIFGIGEEEEKELPEKIDMFLYENLGIHPDTAKIIGSEQKYSRSELVDMRKSQAFLQTQKASAIIGNLKLSQTVTGFRKRLTVFDIMQDSAKKKTLMEIRFQAERDSPMLKIIDVLPEDVIKDVEITQGGVKAGNALVFTLRSVQAGEAQKVAYVVNKELSDLETLTFAAVEIPAPARPSQAAVCGDGQCVPGESYQTCCSDCGCPSGFVCEKNICSSPPLTDECQTDATCDDSDTSTKDTCSGSPKRCSHTPITTCSSGDGYCPADCMYTTDTDCPEQAAQETLPDISGLNITGPQEAPQITELTVIPDNAFIGETLIIEALVIDPNGKDDIKRVWYEVEELVQSHGETGDMNDLGQDEDLEAGDDYYAATALIGEHYLSGPYNMVVFAEDLYGNRQKAQTTFQVFS